MVQSCVFVQHTRVHDKWCFAPNYDWKRGDTQMERMFFFCHFRMLSSVIP